MDVLSHPQKITFLTHPSLTFASKYAEKRGGVSPFALLPVMPFAVCNNTSNNTSTVIKNLEEEFQDSNLYIELVEYLIQA